jgi:hypothetical protein
VTSLGVPGTSLGELATCLGAPATSLGEPQITEEQSGKKNIFFRDAAGVPEIHSSESLFNGL